MDIKYPEFSGVETDDLVIDDLRDPYVCRSVTGVKFDEVYKFASEMGGADRYLLT